VGFDSPQRHESFCGPDRLGYRTKSNQGKPYPGEQHVRVVFLPSSRGRHAGLRTLTERVQFLPVVPTGTHASAGLASSEFPALKITRCGAAVVSFSTRVLRVLGRDLGSVWSPKPDVQGSIPWLACPIATAATSGRACGSYPQRGGFESLRCNSWRWESVSYRPCPLHRGP
jgi:hypothetical protein